jgi:hypothetical protein
LAVSAPNSSLEIANTGFTVTRKAIG